MATLSPSYLKSHQNIPSKYIVYVHIFKLRLPKKDWPNSISKCIENGVSLKLPGRHTDLLCDMPYNRGNYCTVYCSCNIIIIIIQYFARFRTLRTFEQRWCIIQLSDLSDLTWPFLSWLDLPDLSYSDLTYLTHPVMTWPNPTGPDLVYGAANTLQHHHRSVRKTSIYIFFSLGLFVCMCELATRVHTTMASTHHYHQEPTSRQTH